MKTKTYLLGALLYLLVASCSNGEPIPNIPNDYVPINLSRSEKEVATQNNQFAWRLFKTVNQSNKGNTQISPLSASASLSMMAIAANDSVRNEIYSVLNYSSFNPDDVNSYNNKLFSRLTSLDKTTTLSIANLAVCNSASCEPTDWLTADLKSYYSADMLAFNGFNDKAVADINDWCATNTSGHIRDMISLDEIRKYNIVFMTLNALFFKSKWSPDFKFDKESTMRGTFTNVDNSTSIVDYISQSDYKRTNIYYCNDIMSATSIPYGNGAFELVIVLPSEGNTPDDCIDWISTNNMDIFCYSSDRIKVTMPKFSVDYEIDLLPSFKALGCNLITEPQFYPGLVMRYPIFANMVKQKSNLEINEDGAEVSASTIASGGSYISDITQYKPIDIYFKVDRPFIYLIREKSTGAILFLGKVEKF